MNRKNIVVKDVTVVIILGLLLACLPGWCKTIGIWKVAPMYVTAPVLKTLEDAGWRVVILGNTNLIDDIALDNVDVIFMPGGWDVYQLAGFKARRNLVKHVAGGQGLFDNDVNTSKRPLFPQVGITAGYINGARIVANGKSDVAKSIELSKIGMPYSIKTNTPIARIKPGCEGEAFAVIDKTPVGMLGKAFGGRYAIFGDSVSSMQITEKAQLAIGGKEILLTETENIELMDKRAQQGMLTDGDDIAIQDMLIDLDENTQPVKMPGAVTQTNAENTARQSEKVIENKTQPVPNTAHKKTPAQYVLLSCLDWLAAAPELTADEKAGQQAMADLAFLRQERLSDWTQAEDLWSAGYLSVIPEMRRRLAWQIEKRQYIFSELKRKLTDKNLGGHGALINELQQAMTRLNSRYNEVRSNTTTGIEKMTLPELTSDNPFLNPAGVLKDIVTMPAKSDKEKAAIIELVKQCSTANPPANAPLNVAIYLHGQDITEQLMPQEQLTDLTARCDKAIIELQASIPKLVMAPTVEERLRTDPLMAPYYTGNIIPTPQKAEYKDEFLPMDKVAIVVGKDVENPDPLVEVLIERIIRYGGQAAIVNAPGAEHTAVVSLGDTDFARQAKGVPDVPDKDEGYVIAQAKTNGKPLIILKGHDRLGLLWSIASLMQLIHWKDGQTLVRSVTMEDYPILKKRGLILSGNDFFHPARNKAGQIVSYPNTELLLKQNRLFMLISKINEPCYQQLIVADCYGHDWKHPDKMPADAHIEEDLAAIGKNLTPLGISWWAGIRPHAAGDSSPEELSHKLCADEESVEGLLYFARKTEEAGGHLSIILDDIRFPITPYDKERLGTGREVDTFVVTNVLARLQKDYPKARLLVCPPFYWGPLGMGWGIYGEDREEYLGMIGARWPKEIEVFWSGRQVNATTLAIKEHYNWWMSLTKRKPYFWQNCNAYWCHLGRRHYPTDEINSLWANYWDGQFDLLGWYGFNGGNIARYCVTDTISGDFQWNPQAYGKDKYDSARRSVMEAAEKFIGRGSWAMLENVTRPLSFFDGYYLDPGSVAPKDYSKANAALMKQAAKVYDVMEDKRYETMAALEVLKEKHPAGLTYWSALEGFAAWANIVDTIKKNPALHLYRSVVDQRIVAKKAGDFVPEQDVFLAAADFNGGWIQELAVDALDNNNLQPAMVLDGPRRKAGVMFKLTREQTAAPMAILINARQNENAGRLAITLNNKPLFDKKAPFGNLESTLLRLPVPAGLPAQTNIALAISLGADDTPLEVGGALNDALIGGKEPPLAIYYVVIKCGEGAIKQKK